MDGTITRKELRHNSTQSLVPVVNVPLYEEAILYAWGRNDMLTNQKMGIYWFVADPEGYVTQEYTRWETFWTGPGLAQGFIGPVFQFTKVGKYTTYIKLLMNYDDPEPVDYYIGDLAIVIAGAVSEFSELKITKLARV